MFRQAAAAAAAFLLLIGAARADVVYTFVQTSFGGPWSGQYAAPVIDISFALTDAAAQAASFSIRQTQAPYYSVTGGSGMNSLSASAPSLIVGAGSGRGDADISLTFGANGQIISSFLDLSNTLTDFSMSGTSGNVEGSYQTDLGGRCSQTGACTFTGHWTMQTVPVPEPPSLAIVGVGLLGLLGVARRHRAAWASPG